jgi:signal peptidase II
VVHKAGRPKIFRIFTIFNFPGFYVQCERTKSKTTKLLIAAAIIVLNVGADQVTKELARSNLQPRGRVEVVGDYVILVYVENEGAFLSLGSNLPDTLRIALLAVLPAGMVIGMLYFLFFRTFQLAPVQIVALSTIAGGGIGNLYDRITNNGSVVDFMNIGMGRLRTGVFNVADLSVLVGVGLLLIYELKKMSGKKPD